MKNLIICVTILSFLLINWMQTGKGFPSLAEVMQEDADTASEESASGAWTASAGSADSCASLSMDSSGTHSSRCAARAGDASPVGRSPSVSGGASSASECWEYSRGSGGSARAASRPPSRPASRLDRDDNGNPQPQHLRPVCSGDVENDNAAGGDHTPLVKSAAASLQQLRAQFTASAQ